jgi:hypothetical protein
MKLHKGFAIGLIGFLTLHILGHIVAQSYAQHGLLPGGLRDPIGAPDLPRVYMNPGALHGSWAGVTG